MFNLRKVWSAAAVLAMACSGVFAFALKQDKGRLEELNIADPSLVTDVATRDVETLPSGNLLRSGWDRFKAAKSGSWRIEIDARSGAPLLVAGSGIKWSVPLPDGTEATDASIRDLEASLRAFMSENRDLLLARDAELILDRDATGPFGANSYQMIFKRFVNGVEVLGDRYQFHLGYGNLTSFGASRWTNVDVDTTPTMNADVAIETMMVFMGLEDRSKARLMATPVLRIVPARAEGGTPHLAPYAGVIGQGYTSNLVWRVVLEVDGEQGTWVGMVDAHDGTLRAFFDDVRYAQVKGGIFPESPDGICPSGCMAPNYPMPFANVTINGGPAVTSNSMGLFSCTPVGGTAVTALQSPTIRIADACGSVNESTICSASGDFDLSQNAGTNCTVPAGHSAGDTNASRSCFWSANRMKEHARPYFPNAGAAFTFLNDTQTQVNSNVNSTCNAGWTASQQLNMYRATAPSPTGCNNTCEVAGVVQHEWGHGMDQNDGGGFDTSSDGYADVVELLADHTSCIGRGFYMGQTCSGYGDTCLTCTGIRDMNYAARTRNQPARIGLAGNLIASCSSGSGPCGKEVHCEGYLIGETIWDLATRDLPAAGYDAATAWQITDRLWYQSRLGSGGPMYTCTAGSGGCAASSVYARMRVADDDDGNLANGTPHAAAIYAAFARHDHACGAAGDANNQSTSFPPVVSALSLSGSGSTNSVLLSIAATPFTPDAAANFRIWRNDISCDYSFTQVAVIPGSSTSYTDTGLANGFPLYYRVQAIGANPAHESAMSNCVTVTPQPFAGTVVLNQGAYSCSSSIGITVVDGNIGGSTVNVAIHSTTESTPETVTLTQVSPGDPTYTGTINTTAAVPASDGLLSVSSGDTITVEYVDADDGNGGTNVPQGAGAVGDCTAPIISAVQTSNVAGKSALITWSTDEASNSRVLYGPAAPPGASTTVPALVTGHSVSLSGLLECTDYVFAVESTDGVGNAASDDNGGSYFTFTTGLDTSPSFASSGSVSIPDNNAGGGASVINVPTARPIADVDVVVNIDHNSAGQLVLSLEPPSGPAIILSNRRGGTADDFVNTIFDDEATNPISGGTAPFTGRFRPESPLSSTDGILANGNWTLRAVDAVSGTAGTILNWTLAVTFPNQACGPHAKVDGHTTIADICAGGGAGGDGTWDAGETVQLSVDLWNDGTETLTGVSATLTSPTPGVQILDGTAAYPNLVALSGSPSTGPHFTIQVPSGASCNSDLALDVQIDSDQGTWNGSFTHKVGLLQTADAVALSENFNGGIPAGWTVVDGGTGGGPVATWTTANPGLRTFPPPIAAPFAIVDSDVAGSGGPTQDEQLITPVIDLSGALSVTVVFDQFFRWFSGGLDEKGDVDVRSSLTGGNWVNVFRNQGASSPNPDHRSIDITAHAAGAADVQVRFHYYNAQFEWFWVVDNIRLDIVIVPACLNTVCEAAATANPVTSLTASRVDASTIGVVWDAATCASTDYELLYGSLSDLPTYAPLGSVCGLGPSGSATWSSVPAGSLWFVVTGVDNAGTEASWGQATAGERNGTSASGLCGNAARDNTPCP